MAFIAGNDVDPFDTAMSGMSGPINCRRETHCDSDYMAVRREMLSGHLIAETPNEICPACPRTPARTCVFRSDTLHYAVPDFRYEPSKPYDGLLADLIADLSSRLLVVAPMKTSARIPVLSP